MIIKAAMIFDLNKAELPLENDLLFVEDIDLPHLFIIDKICNTYTEDEIVQKIIKVKFESL